MTKEFTPDEEELAAFYDRCTNAHAADMNGRIYGTMLIEVSYSGFRTETRVLKADIERIPYDPSDE